MKSNQNFGVATHILIYLSLFDNEYVTSSKLAKSINTNPVVVRKIMKQLATSNLVETKQGKFGSRLSREACSITLYDIYKIFHDGDILKSKHEPDDSCPLGFIIKDVIDESLFEANLSFENSLKKQTILSIKNKIEEGALK